MNVRAYLLAAGGDREVRPCGGCGMMDMQDPEGEYIADKSPICLSFITDHSSGGRPGRVYSCKVE